MKNLTKIELALVVVIAITLIIAFLRRRKGVVSNLVQAGAPPPPPTTVTFATASGAFKGGKTNPVWTGSEWAQVYGQTAPTLSDLMLEQRMLTPEIVEANICKCGKDRQGRDITCEGTYSNGRLVCKCCGKTK
jgi:hypothetical protein